MVIPLSHRNEYPCIPLPFNILGLSQLHAAHNYLGFEPGSPVTSRFFYPVTPLDLALYCSTVEYFGRPLWCYLGIIHVS